MKLLLFGFFLLISYVQAFCVFNKTDDNTIWVRQMPRFTGGTYTSRFQHDSIGPGESQCCHYSSYDCNTTNDPNTVLELAFQTSYHGIARDYMFTVTLPAGGWIEFRATGSETPQVFVFTDAGVRYVHEIQINPKGMLLL